MYIDERLTQNMQDWLNTEPAQRDFEAGATMMLKLNNNRILYQNAVRRPDKFMAKVEYELRKYLRMRLNNMTTFMVAKLDQELVPKVNNLVQSQELIINADDDNSLPPRVAKGRREDHDKLPVAIQQLYDDNGPIFFKIKEIFTQLQQMENAQPCDRYEYLVQLKDLDTKYHRNLELYDRYDLNADHSDDDGDVADENDAVEVQRKIGAARTYLSDNRKKLEAMKTELADSVVKGIDASSLEKEYDKLLAKVQKRYNYLDGMGVTISDEMLKALRELGVVIVTNSDD